MKVIDLLNKIANGEINEDTLIEFDNGYKDYCSVRIFFDRYIVDRENLNCEVEIIGEDKKIEKIINMNCIEAIDSNCYEEYSNKAIALDINTLKNKINEIIEYLEENK